MASAKKPPLGAVVADLDTADPLGGDDDGTYDASVDEVAELLGVSDDKLDAFRDAFKAAVMSCK